MSKLKKLPLPLLLFFIVLALNSFGLGLSDSIFSNFFKDAYDATAMHRGFIEIPRETPGILCVVLMGFLCNLGDIRISIIALILSAIGIFVLGISTPTYGIMLIFVFINSVGMHLFFTLQEGIGMALVKDDNIGKRMGQYKSVSIGFTMIASIIVFFGFKNGWFSFTTDMKLPFIFASLAFIVCVVILWKMQSMNSLNIKSGRKFKFVFRKEYKFYYILSIMNGVQKQIIFVYGPWVLIELLGFKTDSIALLNIAGAFLGIFFLQAAGKWIDKWGLKKMLYLDAWTFIIVYLIYGIFTLGLDINLFKNPMVPAVVLVLTFICDKLSMQLSIVKTVYLKSIAKCESEIVHTLSLGMSMDHTVSIICATFSGYVWVTWGAQYIFFMACILSLVNLVVAMMVKIPEKKDAAIVL